MVCRAVLKLLIISFILSVNLGFSAITITLSPVLGDENMVHIQAEGSGATTPSFSLTQSFLTFSGTPFAQPLSVPLEQGLTYGDLPITHISTSATGYLMNFFTVGVASQNSILSFQGGPIIVDLFNTPFDEIFNIGTYSITGGSSMFGINPTGNLIISPTPIPEPKAVVFFFGMCALMIAYFKSRMGRTSIC